jgi:hypothetical protein
MACWPRWDAVGAFAASGLHTSAKLDFSVTPAIIVTVTLIALRDGGLVAKLRHPHPARSAPLTAAWSASSSSSAAVRGRAMMLSAREIGVRGGATRWAPRRFKTA